MELLTVLTNFAPDPRPQIPRVVTDENVHILKTTVFAEASTLHIIITAWGFGGRGGGFRRVRDLLQHERQNGAFSGPSLKWERKALLIRIWEAGGGGGGGGGGRQASRQRSEERTQLLYACRYY